MTDIIIYHNSRCSKSRQTLALIEGQKNNINIVNYLESPPTVKQLQKIITLLGFSSARQLMRTKEAIYNELGLGDENDESILLKAMLNNPKLIERPIVLANGKAAIGRPPESVLDII